MNTKSKKNTIKNTITTYDGTPAIRSNCRRIKGEYYEISRQCFMMEDGRWHRIDNGLVIYNHTSGKYVLKSHNKGLIKGIVGVDFKGEVIEGYFEESLMNVSVVHMGTDNESLEIRSINDVFVSKFAKEKVGDGKFYTESYIKYIDVNTNKDVNNFMNNIGSARDCPYNFRLNYNSTYKIPEFLETSKKYFTYDNKYEYAKHLGSTTFGIEHETSGGVIPARVLFRNGLIACRDGSINGHEYVTVPMQGETGLAMIDSNIEALQRYASIDSSCSMHIHLGNRSVDKEYVVSTYKCLFSLQDEIYQMFPEYYKQTSHFKSRDYNNPLPSLMFNNNVESNFDSIYYYLLGLNSETAERFPFDGFGNREHPNDNNGNSKWHVQTRYHLYNLVPMIWSNRGTVEARIHTPTRNKTKVACWLFLNNAILKYAHELRKTISNGDLDVSKLTLDEVIDYSYNSDLDFVEYMKMYVSERKASIKSQGVSTAAKDGRKEVISDLDFKVETSKIKTII